MAYVRGGDPSRHTPGPEFQARVSGVKATPFGFFVSPGWSPLFAAYGQDARKGPQDARQPSGPPWAAEDPPSRPRPSEGVTDMVQDADGVFVPEEGG